MSEVAFAKSFLATLDSRPIKLSADHVEDPKQFGARSAYTLHRMPRPMSKGDAGSKTAPGSEKALTVTIKSLRNPPLDIELSSQTPNTSVLDIKTSVSEQTSIPLEKLKLLHNKRPLVDSKVLKDLVVGTGTTVELSVMVMGGAAAIQKTASETTAQSEVAQGQSGKEAIESAEFWDDLRGFLLQRVRDEQRAAELFETFQTAWKSSSG